MKSWLLLKGLFFLPFADDHPPEAMAVDPFAGGASPLATILLVGLLILIVWWLLHSQTGQVELFEAGHHGYDDEHGDHGHAAQVHTAAPDDLKLVEGIGPKVEAVLNAAGIMTFAELAAAEPSGLQELLDGAGYTYMNPQSWPEQARLAAAGDWEGLTKLQGILSAGRI